MSNENKGRQMLYQSSPAVAALNKVPGFDPLKLLRSTVSDKTKEPVLRLDLPYKKLWFRLANPQGCIRMNALRVTEQMAVYEAQVFLSRDDTQPLVAFTASCTKDEAPNGRYIEAAQWAAVNEALTDAGYGLQFADITMRPEDRRYGSEVTLDMAQKLAANAAAEKDKPVQAQSAPAQTAQPIPTQAVPTQQPKPVATAPVQKAQTVPAPIVPKQQPAVAPPLNVIPMPQPQAETTKAPAEEPQAKAAEVQPLAAESAKEATLEAVPQPASVEPVKQSAVLVQPAPVNMEPVQQPDTPAQPVPVPIAEQPKPEVPVTVDVENTQTKSEPQPAAQAPTYAPETPVDEILKSLTLEQAMDVTVDSGLCNGWKMREVAEKRPVSLRFYVFGAYKGKNNLVRAAAKLVLDSLEQKKAG